MKFVVGAVTLVVASVAAPTVAADPLPTVIVGTFARDILIGTRHNDVIIGLRGNDTLVGSRGNDILRGMRGDDTLRAAFPDGHSGHDILRGGLGRDRCFGDSSDVFFGCEVIVVR